MKSGNRNKGSRVHLNRRDWLMNTDFKGEKR
jgi:hypothetical protein